MRLVLRQRFPLGRFHATRWRINPFDEPFGEWPPSPWHYVRSIAARWYQWQREAVPQPSSSEFEELLTALCNSTYSYYLPLNSRKGAALRQYQPVEFGWKPPDKFKKKKVSGKDVSIPVKAMRMYGTSLVQDNYVAVPVDDPVWWFIEDHRWTTELARLLDCCLERLTYFGRAESFTTISRVVGPEQIPLPNCELAAARRSSSSLWVVVPEGEATRADIERVTDDPSTATRSLPRGARIMYADFPTSSVGAETVLPCVQAATLNVMQFAIAWNVPPTVRDTVRLTAQFRSRALRELVKIKTSGSAVSWSTAPGSVRAAIARMIGKDASGNPLSGHRHAEFFVWFDSCRPTRIIAWRGGSGFDADEQAALLGAASAAVSWTTGGSTADAWKVNLLPLDTAVPAPAGFDGTNANVWESVTPFVPARHYLRRGNVRRSESLPQQICRELSQRGLDGSDGVEVEEIKSPTWVATHFAPRQGRRSFIGDSRGNWLRLTFKVPVAGPLRLGRSSSFGLGLFRPVVAPK